MFSQIRCALSFAVCASVVLSADAASAQWVNSSACGCATPMVRTPVVQRCYQQVAVTEYQRVKQKVRRPVTEVEYVDQPVTTYRPVTETRTVDVPTTRFQNVTECRTVTKNYGYWRTNYYRNQKMSACQYDPRPGVLPFFNRTGYRIRSAFTPSVVATRQYVPQTVAQQVPVTRQVPITTVQKQTYQVTKYVPQTTTRRVAVNKVRWVEQEVVALKPVTVMKTVPTTRTAWTWAPAGTTAISYGTPTTTVALSPTLDPVTSRTSNKAASETNSTPTRVSTRTKEEDAKDDRGDINRIDTSSLRQPITPRVDPISKPVQRQRANASKKSLFVAVPPRQARSAGLVRVGGWKSSQERVAKTKTTPLLLPSDVSVASANE